MSNKKVQLVEANLILKEEQEFVTVNGRSGITDSKCLIEFLRRNIKNETLKSGKKITKNSKLFEPGYNKYCFERYDYNDRSGEYDKSLFVVKFKTSEKSYHYETYKSIEDLLEIKRQKLKVNRARLVAAVGAGIILLSVTGPTLVKGLENLLEKDYNYDQGRYHQIQELQEEKPSVTEEQKQQSLDEYYKELEQKAKEGDKEAIEEYSAYIAEQQLKEQAEEYHKYKN